MQKRFWLILIDGRLNWFEFCVVIDWCVQDCCGSSHYEPLQRLWPILYLYYFSGSAANPETNSVRTMQQEETIFYSRFKKHKCEENLGVKSIGAVRSLSIYMYTGIKITHIDMHCTCGMISMKSSQVISSTLSATTENRGLHKLIYNTTMTTIDWRTSD